MTKKEEKKGKRCLSFARAELSSYLPLKREIEALKSGIATYAKLDDFEQAIS